MKTKFFTALLLMMVMAIPAFAGYDMYLTINGVAGTPADINHKDWLPVTEIVENTIKPGGAVSLVINKPVDGNSALLYRNCLTGRPNPGAILDICKDGVLLCKITLHDAMISQIKPKITKLDPVYQEELTFSFSTINWDFYAADGKVATQTGWNNETHKSM
jgi:type VI protein secretion system component Hcp